MFINVINDLNLTQTKMTYLSMSENAMMPTVIYVIWNFSWREHELNMIGKYIEFTYANNVHSPTLPGLRSPISKSIEITYTINTHVKSAILPNRFSYLKIIARIKKKILKKQLKLHLREKFNMYAKSVIRPVFGVLNNIFRIIV